MPYSPSSLPCSVVLVVVGGGTGSSVSGGSSSLLVTMTTVVPEIYDAAVQCMALLLVLTSTQLYRPMVSSWQGLEAIAIMRDGDGGAAGDADAAEDVVDHYFLRRIMEEASKRGSGGSNGGSGDNSNGGQSLPPSSSSSSSSSNWTAQSVLASLLNVQIARPRPPSRSISAHHIELATMVAQHARGERVGPDGMYETHAIVMAQSPQLDARGKPIAPSSSSSASSSAAAAGVNGGGGVAGGASHLPQHMADGISSTAASAAASSSALEVKSGSADPNYVPRTSADGALSALHVAALRRGPTRAFVDATRGVLHLSSTLLLLPFRLMSLALTLFGRWWSSSRGSPATRTWRRIGVLSRGWRQQYRRGRV